MNTYCIRGFNKAKTRFMREDIEAASEGHAVRLFRAAHPDAGDLHCRPPKHGEAILAALACLPVAERVAA
jgi:hypothetical protein